LPLRHFRTPSGCRIGCRHFLAAAIRFSPFIQAFFSISQPPPPVFTIFAAITNATPPFSALLSRRQISSVTSLIFEQSF